MAFDYAAFKAKWRTLAAERGIDPVEGATAFQAVAVQTEERKRTHYARQRVAIFNDAAKSGAWRRYDNGLGEVDEAKVERQARRDWWVYAEYWRGGGRRVTIVRPKWTAERLRVTDSARHTPIILISLSDEQLEELVVSRIPPPDLEAVRNIRRDARRLEGQGEERTRAEDKRAMWREAWAEDGAARKRQKAAVTAQVNTQKQMAFAFA